MRQALPEEVIHLHTEYAGVGFGGGTGCDELAAVKEECMLVVTGARTLVSERILYGFCVVKAVFRRPEMNDLDFSVVVRICDSIPNAYAYGIIANRQHRMP